MIGDGKGMIYQIVAIALKELKVLWHDREALTMLFAMPMFFILVMSFALEGVFEAGRKGQPIELLILNQDEGSISKQVINDLKQVGGLILIETHHGTLLTLDKVEQLIREQGHPMALIFQKDFSERILQANKNLSVQETKVFLMVDPVMNQQLVAPIRGTIQGILERSSLLAQIPQRMKQELAKFSGIPTQSGIVKSFEEKFSSQHLREKGAMGMVFQTVYPSNFKRERRPTSTEQNVPGYTIFGVFFIVLALASSFHQEKIEGTFLRIQAAPLSKTAFLIGKLLPYYLMNLIQMTLMFAVGVVVFAMKLGHFSSLLLVSLALAASANGLGLLVASLAKTEAQINSLSMLFALTLAALGGMMVPTFVMPEWMKTLSLFTPHAWGLTGYHDVIVRGLGPGEVLPEVCVLLGFACGFFTLALWRFRFH
jgi:ABC-2 type transport system permease protein